MATMLMPNFLKAAFAAKGVLRDAVVAVVATVPDLLGSRLSKPTSCPAVPAFDGSGELLCPATPFRRLCGPAWPAGAKLGLCSVLEASLSFCKLRV
jgi:hypothetical protein